MTSGVAEALLTLANDAARPDQAAASDLACLDAVETAARIRSGELSAAEAVEAAIARAERVNPKINAIVSRNYDRARNEARLASGPWAGVPTFIKDLDDIEGEPTTFGSRAFAGFIGKMQSPLIDAFLNSESSVSASRRRRNSVSPRRPNR